jgi:hypothetical protein
MLINRRPEIFLIMFVLAVIAMLTQVVPISADANTTGSVKIIKYAADGVTINAEISLTYEWMRDNLPVYGDGTTHYYHQGAIFNGENETARWNMAEDTNIEEKDMGAVQGTNVKDLCDLVGDMSEGEEVKLRAPDGFSKKFAYKNVYKYSSREGPIVLTWCKDGMYPDTGYDEGMRNVWFADTSKNPWGYHVFGNWDWHEAADEEYWHYFDEEYPTTTGLSVQKISEIIIFSSDPPFWDPDGSGACDTGDVESIGSQWHKEGEPGWIPEDVNRDGVVNILDGVKVGMYWGQKY